MSFQAMTWAVDQTCGSAATKLVLLMLANHSNGHTGQCNPRHKRLAAECDMTVDTLKAHLKKLDAMGLIEIIPQFAEGVQLPNQYIVKMHGGGVNIQGVGGGKLYGEGGGKNCPPNNQECNQEGNHPPTPEGDESTAGFAKFWETYPKKVGKDAAQSAWKRKVRSLETHSDLMNALQQQKVSEAWTKDGGRFVPNPATWLNQGRWKDEAVADRSANAFAGVI